MVKRKHIAWMLYLLGFFMALVGYQHKALFGDSDFSHNFFFWMCSIAISFYLYDSWVREENKIKHVIRFGVWMSANIACLYEFMGEGAVYNSTKLMLLVVILAYTIYVLKFSRKWR